MAEGWARHLKSDVINAYSAGVAPQKVSSRAIAVMKEAGVDISGHHSKHVNDLAKIDFDYIITVCSAAHERCPIFSGKAKVVHVGFEDPPKLTKEMPDGEAKLAVYRRVRDEIRRFVETLPGALTAPQ